MFIYQGPERERKIKSMQGRPLSNRVDQTLEHVSKNWIPVNPRVLKEVQEKLNDGEYRRAPSRLLEDIKSDPNLFLHTVRALKTMVPEEEHGIDPFEVLAKLEEDKLRRIICVPERQISTHRLKDMAGIQALRIQHSVISSRAAENLAPRVRVDPQLAWSGSVIRQLGHNLVAWNYPELYSRALASQRHKGLDLDFELSKLLGMTPLQIGAKFAANWNLTADLKMAVLPRRRSIREDEDDGDEDEQRRLPLTSLCEVSEKFARANDPEHFPGALDKWKEAETRLREITGGSVFEGLYDKVVSDLSLCDNFIGKPLSTPYFKRAESLDQIPEWARALYSRNMFASRCPDGVRVMFGEVYKQVEQAAVSVAAIKVLAEKLIPYAGFVRGCFYVLDNDTSALRPLLRVGDVPLERYRVIPAAEDHPVADALYASVPLRQEGRGVKGTTVIQIAGSLMARQRPGVLYLEVSSELAQNINTQSFVCFQAIRQCLADCLGEPERTESGAS